MKKRGSIKKSLLVGVLILSIGGLVGCDSKGKGNNNNNNENTTSQEDLSKKELTPLQKEISELKDYQITDKIYDNKDLEPFNKMQGYYYSISKNGKDTIKQIDIIPPTEDGLKELEKFGEDYKLIGNVVIPCYFIYSEYTEEWLKCCPFMMDDTNFKNYVGVKPEYKFISDEELDKVFGREETEVERQFTIKK